ncbi:endonuclease V [Chondromyces apiculatus]|uniref:Endonuclease V n=1 Tax=Chondromyces apiculatus DSM 436 TaxID=1192034 RepID=A0A017T0T0_9BACT|nr:endonuclease V [Chondromyces apiculatus]EYF02838.1 Hypothetical protein CAP_6418 [Chondromyces apiculatus DSM 436]
MIACLDVSYGQRGAAAACLLFRAWTDAHEQRAHVAHVAPVAPYQPGAFYLRELPCLMAVLQQVEAPLATIVVDGFVWLSAERRPGLGAHLFEALGGEVVVVGVAKTGFHGAEGFAEPVLRGVSRKPLYVTASGTDAATAAGWIRAMHGAHRIPTLLQRVDRLCRQESP